MDAVFIKNNKVVEQCSVSEDIPFSSLINSLYCILSEKNYDSCSIKYYIDINDYIDITFGV